MYWGRCYECHALRSLKKMLNNVSIVRLHGHKIAEVGDDYLTLFDAGYQTKTTKSRLNAILGEFGYTCGTKREYIFQDQFCKLFILVDTLCKIILETLRQ